MCVCVCVCMHKCVCVCGTIHKKSQHKYSTLVYYIDVVDTMRYKYAGIGKEEGKTWKNTKRTFISLLAERSCYRFIFTYQILQYTNQEHVYTIHSAIKLNVILCVYFHYCHRLSGYTVLRLKTLQCE